MSRCYPFPPPGYIRIENFDESLIKSIKGTKVDLKKDRKHKKERKRKEREHEVDRSKKHSDKRRRKDDFTNGSKKVDDHHGLVNSEVEFLEKSCLTVELELQSSSQNSCGSTFHESQSPSPSQPLDGRHNDSETGIWIGLPDKGLKNPEVKVQNQSTYRGKFDVSQSAHRHSIGHSANQAPQDALRVCKEKRIDPNFDSLREITTKLSKGKDRKDGKEKKLSSSLCTHPEQEKHSSSHEETMEPSKLLCSKCPPYVAVHFLNLIENWAPDRVESKLVDSEDEEWWFLMKFGAKRHDQVSYYQEARQGSSSMVWPTARFLPEAELHALTFTVPF